MENDLSNVEKILKTIKMKKHTSREISEINSMPYNIVCVVMNDLEKRNRVIPVKYYPKKYRNSDPKTLLELLYEIMVKKMKAVKELTKEEITTIKIINRVLEIVE